MLLNAKHIAEGLDHKNLREITIQCHSDHIKHKYELVNKPKKKCIRNFKDEKLAVKVIMDCRTTSVHKFRTWLGLFKYDVISTKLVSSFEGQNMLTQWNVLSYRVDLYFHEYELPIEIDENGHSYRNIDYEIKRQKKNKTRTWL